jgi:PAS domain S-box-containing protein
VGLESQDQLAQLLEQSPALIALTRLRDGTVVSVNAMFERLSGYTRAEALGRTLFELGIYARQEQRQVLLEALERDGHVRDLEMAFRARDGSTRTTLVSADVVQCDGEPCILSVVTDISARKQAEEDLARAKRQLEHLYAELQRSEGWFRAVFDHAGVGILSLGPAGHVERANPAALRICGRAAGDLLRRPPDSFMHPDDQAELRRLLVAQREGALEAFETERRCMRADGTLRWVQVHVTPFRDGDGRLESALLVLSDITAHRDYEDRLHQARESAETASRAKGSFLARMSDTLRAPLADLLERTEGLLAESAEPLAPGQRQAVAAARDRGRQLLEAVGGIRDLARLEDNALALEPRTLAVAEALHRALDEVAEAAAEKGQSLHLEGESGRLRCRVDPGRLHQVLVHLLSNAVRYTPEGGRIAVRAEPVAAGVGIAVGDTGIGIPEAEREALFEPFARGAHDQPGDGAGLGLAVSRRLARLWGGDVTVQSAVGAGSTFTVTVPGAGPGPAGPRGARPRPLVLVAEDNDVNTQVLRDYLEVKGYAVTEAVNGSEAVDATLRLEPDLVVMDIQMPVLDGLEAMRQIRSAGFARLPIVALTALAMPGDRERCLEAGADDYVSKPVSLRGLVERMEALLGRG